MATESTIRHAIGDTDRILQNVEGVTAHEKNVTLTAAEGFVLSRVDGSTSVAEIAAISPLDDDETFRCIYSLISTGILRLEDTLGNATGRLPRVSTLDAEPTVTEAATDDTDTDPMVEEIEAKRSAMEQSNFYEILEVKRGETPEALKKAYYALAKKYHPDRHQSCETDALKDQLTEILAKLAYAYDVLSNRSKRLRYDNKLSQTEGVDPELVGTVRTSPDVLAETKYRAGRGCYQAKDYHEAVQNLREAVNLDPTKIAYHKLLGQALTKNPLWRKQAETHLRRVLDAEPYDKDCYLELATIYEEGGLTTRARQMYERVASLDPHHKVALKKARLRRRGGKGRVFLQVHRKNGRRVALIESLRPTAFLATLPT